MRFRFFLLKLRVIAKLNFFSKCKIKMEMPNDDVWLEMKEWAISNDIKFLIESTEEPIAIECPHYYHEVGNNRKVYYMVFSK